MMASSAPYLAVIDADMQHDERILPAMLGKLKRDSLDIVVATRRGGGGTMGEMPGTRRAISGLGRRLSRLACPAPLSDPMSGYFVLTRGFLDEVVRSLSNTGFKILIDLIASSNRPVRVAEVGYSFRPRLHGASKLDFVVTLEYLQLLVEKLVGGWVPVSYVLFGCVGAIGVGAQLLLIQLFRALGWMSLGSGQLVSSALVIGLNYTLNNQWTFRSSRLRGARFWIGMASFYAACSIGLFLNYSVFAYLRQVSSPWVVAASAGIVLGSVWNYWISTLFVWQIKRRRRGNRLYSGIETSTLHPRNASGSH
jgi:dolichol-phosphate mannosyltransferase